MNAADSHFIVARNPSGVSRLPFLLCVPLHSGALWLKTRTDWPRSERVYCHPLLEPPTYVDEIARVPIRACIRRGPCIDLVLDRAQNHRSQFIETEYRGRKLLFWQSARAAKAARPNLRVPKVRARMPLELIIDAHERYGYTFADLDLTVAKERLAVGDYAVRVDGKTVAAVERKTLADLANSLVNGGLGFAMAELATLPFAAVVVEGRYSDVMRYPHVRAGFLPELLARLAVRYPAIPIHFLENRKLANHWTAQFLVAAGAAAPLPLTPPSSGS